jgi:hypothetical protein
MSGGDPGRLAALLELCREAVDEIVVALDERVDPERAGRVVELADTVLRAPYAPPPERMLPWLYAQCRGDWILKLDDDEVPGRAFLDGLRDAADPAVTHVWFPRRWLFGDADGYLDAAPWVPDFQLRLSVNDERLVRFPGVLHVPVEVAGPARYADAPIYHLDLLRPREERELKVAAYERERPGLRSGGLAFNHALYVPELGDARLAPLPPEDAPLVRRVAGAPPAPVGDAPALPRATREEVDALRVRTGDTAELELRRAPARAEAGERFAVTLLVRNRAPRPLASPAVQIGTRWDGVPGGWSPLPSRVEPGVTELVLAVVEAPRRAGRHELELDLVHDGVRWFGASVRATVEVAPRRRVGILVREVTRDRAQELARAVVLRAPRLEPLVLGAADAGGYPVAPGPEPELTAGLAAGVRKLRSFAAAERRFRELRRRGGPPIEGLVLAGLEATTLLERWTDLAAATQAADRRAPVLLPGPPAPRSALDRLLLARLLRLPGVRVAEGPLEEALSPFLAEIERRSGLS